MIRKSHGSCIARFWTRPGPTLRSRFTRSLASTRPSLRIFVESSWVIGSLCCCQESSPSHSRRRCREMGYVMFRQKGKGRRKRGHVQVRCALARPRRGKEGRKCKMFVFLSSSQEFTAPHLSSSPAHRDDELNYHGFVHFSTLHFRGAIYNCSVRSALQPLLRSCFGRRRIKLGE